MDMVKKSEKSVSSFIDTVNLRLSEAVGTETISDTKETRIIRSPLVIQRK